MRVNRRAARWLVLSGLAAGLIVLQGCMAMIYRADVLSDNGGAGEPAAVPLPLVAGVRVGTVDGEFNGINEHSLISDFVAALSAANLFQQITYPTTDHEDVMFEIGGKFMIKRPYAPLMVADAILCGFTLYLICFPNSVEYDYTVAVRAVAQNDDEVIGRYRATGISRITYGILQVGEPESVEVEGWQLAVTSAENQLVAKIRSDEAEYRRWIKP
jgi:hypothetical protein